MGEMAWTIDDFSFFHLLCGVHVGGCQTVGPAYLRCGGAVSDIANAHIRGRSDVHPRTCPISNSAALSRKEGQARYAPNLPHLCFHFHLPLDPILSHRTRSTFSSHSFPRVSNSPPHHDTAPSPSLAVHTSRIGMAGLPAATPPAFTQHGTNDARAQAQPPADPFYQSTPRTAPPGLGLSTLVASMQQVSHPELPATGHSHVPSHFFPSFSSFQPHVSNI